MDGARFFSLEGEEVMALIEYLSDTEGPKIETVEMKKDVHVGVDEEEKKGEEEDGKFSFPFNPFDRVIFFLFILTVGHRVGNFLDICLRRSSTLFFFEALRGYRAVYGNLRVL